MTDADFEALSSVTISAQPPMAVPAARTMLPQLNRLSSSSLGTSTDVAAAAAAARSFSRCRSFALRIDASRRGGSDALLQERQCGHDHVGTQDFDGHLDGLLIVRRKRHRCEECGHVGPHR